MFNNGVRPVHSGGNWAARKRAVAQTVFSQAAAGRARQPWLRDPATLPRVSDAVTSRNGIAAGG